MRVRPILVLALLLAFLTASPGSASESPSRATPPKGARPIVHMPRGFVPAVATQVQGLARYFVVMRAPSVADGVRAAVARDATDGASAQRSAFDAARRSQDAAVAQAKAMGGTIVFRYGRLVNAFSARLSPAAVAAMRARDDVASVQPVSIVRALSNESTKFIGAPAVWGTLGVRGEGMRVALVDTGIDYTHADFGGPGTPEAYEDNDPSIIEPGTFPTSKVIGGTDLVGQNYDVLDDDPTNDVPVPDPDPLDKDGHGTHTAGTVAGFGIPGIVQSGVAPKAKLYAIKVWDVGNSTDDVLVAGYEYAVDPNQDGSTDDHADVLSFSGGVDYGTQNSVEALASQSVVDVGTVFVAAAGNAGNQPTGGSAYITGTPANTPGVISVAASIDSVPANTLTVNEPEGVVLPDGGYAVHQSWSDAIDSDITTDIYDAREVDPPADPGDPQPSDRMLCDQLPGTPLAGKFVLIFKGSTGDGDCSGSTKVYNAQLAGATGVVLWSGFTGPPFDLGTNGEDVTIPAVMLDTADGATLGDTISPDAGSGSFNTVTVNATIHSDLSPIPGFEDSMTDFTSEGPARVTNALKPDISAPGFDITSAGIGTGNGGAVLSGTSMATPHVAGSAVLLRQLHPTWTPDQIKAVLMNNATLRMKNNDLSEPVAATVMGAGRVQVDVSATAVSLVTPGSLSFGLQPLSKVSSFVQRIQVTNNDGVSHDYSVNGEVRYADFRPAVAGVTFSLNGSTYNGSVSFSLAAGASRTVRVKLTLDPSFVTKALQEDGWYYFHPGVDGEVFVHQSGGGASVELHVPWQTTVMASTDSELSASTLDLTTGTKKLKLLNHPSTAVPAADLYLLGASSDTTTGTEEDIAAIGARSFTGSTIDGTAEALPPGRDAYAHLTWLQFLTDTDVPREPVEFGVEMYTEHDTTETLEVDVAVDAGADGVFADPGLRADYLVVKPAAVGGTVCVYDLSLPNPYDSCAATYFADYSNYNSRIVGLAVDASAIGLTDAAPEVAYQVTACTGRYSGDVPAQICDIAGGFDGTTYTARLNATNPALRLGHMVCGGFWGGSACDTSDPVRVSIGSAASGSTPVILALFPNDPPTVSSVTLVRTQA